MPSTSGGGGANRGLFFTPRCRAPRAVHETQESPATTSAERAKTSPGYARRFSRPANRSSRRAIRLRRRGKQLRRRVERSLRPRGSTSQSGKRWVPARHRRVAAPRARWRAGQTADSKAPHSTRLHCACDAQELRDLADGGRGSQRRGQASDGPRGRRGHGAALRRSELGAAPRGDGDHRARPLDGAGHLVISLPMRAVTT